MYKGLRMSKDDFMDLCEECAIEEGSEIIETQQGDLFVCKKCFRKLRKFRKKVNHGEPPVE